MRDNVQCSITIVAKEKGIDGKLMRWLLWTQHRLEGTPGNFRATKKYKQYEHSFPFTNAFCYEAEFFKGVKYTKRAMRKAEKAMSRHEDCQVKEGSGDGENILKKIIAFWRE